ncbi:MAG: 16S rRNA (guanine(527)-N(7))-methyltransferase RsmG [Candidatus Altimarinota bacterium]
MNLSTYLPTLSPHQLQQLEHLADLFLDWNSKLNLSAIRDREGVLLKHIVDSLLILPFHFIQPGQKVLDMGTGGGFPGLALAIAYPEADFTLVDATEKKIKAVSSMAQSLGLKNVRCLSGRAEEMGQDRKYREQYDLVVARALAHFSTLLEYCLPFVKVGGHFIAYQGPELIDEWKNYQNVAALLSARILQCEEALLPLDEAKRCFIVVEKTKPLSSAYPRRVGVPKKTPLLA